MITFTSANGSHQVLRPNPAFFSMPMKGDPSIHKKCEDIMLDLGAISYKLKRD